MAFVVMANAIKLPWHAVLFLLFDSEHSRLCKESDTESNAEATTYEWALNRTSVYESRMPLLAANSGSR